MKVIACEHIRKLHLAFRKSMLLLFRAIQKLSMQKAAVIWHVASAFLHDCLFCVIGKDTPIDEIVDFIVAAQLAEKYAEESEDSLDGADVNEEDEDVVPVAARGPEVFRAFNISVYVVVSCYLYYL